MRAAARGMRALGIAPDLVLTSPLVRCRQTAEIVCEALGGTPVEDPRLKPGMRLGDLEDALLDHPGAKSPLVCGHEPDLSEIVAELTGGGMVDFKKGGLAILDVETPRPGGGRLRALYPPAALRLLGE
jgi:phosphohistidine phosphatase